MEEIIITKEAKMVKVVMAMEMAHTYQETVYGNQTQRIPQFILSHKLLKQLLVERVLANISEIRSVLHGQLTLLVSGLL